MGLVVEPVVELLRFSLASSIYKVYLLLIHVRRAQPFCIHGKRALFGRISRWFLRWVHQPSQPCSPATLLDESFRKKLSMQFIVTLRLCPLLLNCLPMYSMVLI